METANSIAHLVYAHFTLSILLGLLGKNPALGVGGSRLSRAEMVMLYSWFFLNGFSRPPYACAGVAGLSIGAPFHGSWVTSTSVVRMPVKGSDLGSADIEVSVSLPFPPTARSCDRFWKISTPTRA